MEELRAGSSAAEISKQSKKSLSIGMQHVGLEQQRAQELGRKKEALDSGFDAFFDTDMLSL